MARWYEGAEESAFKPTAGGYVFQPPSLWWPSKRTPAYLVNEAQKAALAACLRRQRLQTLLVVFGVMLVGMALGVLIVLTRVMLRISALEFAAFAILALVAVFAISLFPYFIAVRAMRPLLAGVPLTDQRITVGEQFERLAGAISPKLLWLGGAGGMMMIVGSLMSLGDAMADGHSVFRFPWLISTLGFGALLTGYFVYLGMLRRKAKRNA